MPLLVVISTPVLVAVLAPALRSKSVAVWILTFAGLIILASGLHLYLVRIPLIEPEIWLGVLCSYVFPIAVASTLTRLLAPTTQPWVMGMAALASYIAALFLGLAVGIRLGAIFG